MHNSYLRLAGFENDSITDGPGLRFTVFAQGCKHNCKGCHNPETHDVNGGKKYSVDEVFGMIKKNPLLDGVTFSGGEPFLQTSSFLELAKKVVGQSLNIIIYTGFVYDEIIDMGVDAYELLGLAKYIVDGRFIESKASYELRFKGSENQRFIDVEKSLAEGKIVTAFKMEL